MSARTKDGYHKFIHDFIDEVLVVCPQCSGAALVKGKKLFIGKNSDGVKVTCTSCGFNKKLDKVPSAILYSRQTKILKGRYVVLGTSIDPFFKLPLWLQASVNGNNFWAYNYEHLDLIRSIVEAKLRERNTSPNYNGSVASRLPRWVTAKGNRDSVLKAIDKLKQK